MVSEQSWCDLDKTSQSTIPPSLLNELDRFRTKRRRSLSTISPTRPSRLVLSLEFKLEIKSSFQDLPERHQLVSTALDTITATLRQALGSDLIEVSLLKSGLTVYLGTGPRSHSQDRDSPST